MYIYYELNPIVQVFLTHILNLWSRFIPYSLSIVKSVVTAIMEDNSFYTNTHKCSHTSSFTCRDARIFTHSNIYLHTFRYLGTHIITLIRIQFQLHTHNRECTHCTHENYVSHTQVLININIQHYTLSWSHSQHICTSVIRRTVVSSNFWMPQNGSFPPLHSASNPVTITKKIFTTIHNILK